MGTQVTTARKNLYVTIREIDFLGTDDLPAAMDIFNEYTAKKVLLNADFTDNIWLLSDEYHRVGLDFSVDELALKKSPVFNAIKYIDFIAYIKMYVVRLLGSYVTQTIQSFIRELKDVIISFDGNNLNTKIKLMSSNLIYEFVEMIDLSNSMEYDRLLTVLEVATEKNMYKHARNRRQLSTFQSYFKFNDIIDDFWDKELTSEQRTFYFPLYLWWHITTILPLRPREFLLIPRDCFRDEQNFDLLTLRRTNLKGMNKNVTYSIANDYSFYQYNVGEKLAEQIRLYIDLTKNFEPNELDTLFRADIHYNYFGKTKRYDSRLFTYANMRYCLKKFYTDVIQDEYEQNIVRISHHNDENMISNDTYGLKEKEIEFINLGDTRHIAMINIVASGGTPTTAMMLAGHTSIDISSHYFANISTLIECKTYQNYSKTVDKTDTMIVLDKNPKYSLLSADKFTNLGDGCKCYSELYFKGDYQDCFKSVGENGEIGDCIKCSHYRSGNFRIFVDDKDIYTQRITDDCDFLAEQLKLYRKAKGYEEDVKQAILRLQNSTKSYEKYFQSNLIHGGK